MPLDLLLVTIGKALVELAGLFVAGQGLLYLLAGRNREGNFFYQLFKVLTRPLYNAVRFVTPKAIVDRHIPIVTFIVLFWLWLILTFAKIQICAEQADRCLPPAGGTSLEQKTVQRPGGPGS